MNTDPKIIGPGTWFSIHITAKNAITKDSKDAFIQFMELLRNTFPCLKCRKHINEYMDKNPIRDFYMIRDDKGNDIGMFKYSWLFHNTVNTRLNKPYIDWNTAWSMYSDDTSSVCNIGCNDEDNDTESSNYYISYPKQIVTKGSSNSFVTFK